MIEVLVSDKPGVPPKIIKAYPSPEDKTMADLANILCRTPLAQATFDLYRAAGIQSIPRDLCEALYHALMRGTDEDKAALDKMVSRDIGPFIRESTD